MAWTFSTGTVVTSASPNIQCGTAGTGRLIELAIFMETDVAALGGVTIDGKAATRTVRAPHTNGLNSVELWRIDEAALGASAGVVPLSITGWTANMVGVLSIYTSDNGLLSATAFTRADQAATSSVTVLDALSAVGNLCTFAALSASSSQFVDTWPTGMTENVSSQLTGILCYGNARGIVGAGFTPPAGDDYTSGFSGSSSAGIGVVVVYVEAAGGGGGGGGGGSPVGAATGQYGVGTATFTLDSAVVTGTGTEWSSHLSPGNLIAPFRGRVLYEILTVDSDTQVTLVSPWKLPTTSARQYVAVRDFTSNYSLPTLSQLDFDTNNVLARALALVDAKLADLSNRAPGA